MGLVVLPHVGSFHVADRLGRSANGAADRTIAVDGQLEGVVDRVRGRVLPHRQLIEDDAALHREIYVVEARVGDHVGQRLDRHVKVRVTHARPVGGVLARGLRVRLAAHAVEGDGDVEGGTLVRPLKQKVLEEVGRPGRARPLVSRADGHPQGHARALRRGNLLGQDARPGSQDRAINAGVAVLDGQAGLVERQRLRRHTSPLASPSSGGWHETFTV